MLKLNPIPKYNLFSALTFWWLNDLFAKGNKQQLQENDMFKLDLTNTSALLCDQLEKNWKKEETKTRNSQRRPSLLKALFNTYKIRLAVLGIFLAVLDSLRTGLPLLIAGLVRYFENQDSVEIWEAYAFAAAISAVTTFLAIAHHLLFYKLQQLGWHIRTSTCGLMYKKTLRLTQQSLNQTTTGKIINLSSNDVMRFNYIPQMINFIWIAPVQCIAIAIILWQEVGVAIFTGIALLVLVGCIQAIIGRIRGKLRNVIAHLTDERIRLVSEIITSMRVIKMHAWEKPFSKLVLDARKKEVNKIILSAAASALNTCVSLFQDKILVLGILLTYIGMGGVLTASKVFAIIGILQFQGRLAYKFGLGIQNTSEAQVSVKRIEDYLLLSEVDPYSDLVHSLNKDEKAGIEFQNFSASWITFDSGDVEADKTLSDINLQIKAETLLMVIGQVASGKSSFLNAIMGELPPIDGKVIVTGKSVYVNQVPWVFSGTIRENILFGEEYDQTWYNSVINACCLKKDLKSLVDGDLTLVGERGITLSGGQKSRINLARAAYRRDVDIFLLDDPLSSVDASVAQHIFRHCILGIMGKKIRVLVTHQLQFLKKSDEILILSEGKISSHGTYDELNYKGVEFTRHSHTKEYEDKILLDDILEASPITIPSRKIGNRSRSHSTTDFLSGQQHFRPPPIRSSRRTSLTPSFKMPPKNFNQDFRKNSILASIYIPDTANFQDIVPEDRKQGDIGGKLYLEYFRSGANVFLLIVFVLITPAYHVIYIIVDWWLAYWISNYDDVSNEPQNSTYSQTNTPSSGINSSVTSIDYTEPSNFDTHYYASSYAGFVAGMLIVLLVKTNMHFYICAESGFNLHKKMFQAIMKAPIRFFDINPSGRILNRFSKDMGIIDERLPLVLNDFLFMGLVVISSVILATIINYFVIIVVIPLIVYFLWLRRYYLRTSRDIKRLEGTCRSPMFSLISSTLDGLLTVRSSGEQDYFVKRFNEYQDLHGASWFLFLVCSRWFGLRLDLITAIFVSAVSFLCVIASSILGINAGEVGLILTYSVAMANFFQFGVRRSAEVENLMTSVERIHQYCKIPPESQVENTFIPNKPDNWPANGSIRFENVSFSYYEYGPTVLNNIDFEIFDKEKVGVVGRTGAGKSSLISALLRLSEIKSGQIYISGIGINSLELSVLRSAISTIPQDPMLFSGSIRRNIDPFDQYSDEDVWDALEQVQLKDHVDVFPMKLSTVLAEFGSNFSVGQRQLICLARVILKPSKILVIDEATANVDMETDRLIQETIRHKFKQCTVITIAHRINTVIDSDKILVLNDGKVEEFGEPHILLKNNDGHLSSMVRSCGFMESRSLRLAAKKAYHNKHKILDE